jgi:WXXGXW repeat (2 copies)
VPAVGSTTSTVVIAPQAPPAPRIVPPPPPPRPGVVWLPGHWAWRPARATFVWIHGRYAEPSQLHAAWVPGHWAQRPQGWVWETGHWD